MRHWIQVSIVGLLFVCPTGWSQDTPPITEPQSGQGQARIRFSGTSTLHDFAGHVDTEPFNWAVHRDPNSQRWQVRGTVDVLVAKMDTDNAKRDRRMRSMFHSERFPLIRGTVENAHLAAVPPTRQDPGPDGTIQERPGRLPLTVTICGRSQRVTAAITDLESTGPQTRFTMAFDLSLKAFGLTAPSVMGIIRVGDRVHLEAQVRLTQHPTPEPTTDTSAVAGPTRPKEAS